VRKPIVDNPDSRASSRRHAREQTANADRLLSLRVNARYRVVPAAHSDKSTSMDGRRQTSGRVAAKKELPPGCDLRIGMAGRGHPSECAVDGLAQFSQQPNLWRDIRSATLCRKTATIA
jgi:hypothetical protein